MAKHEYHYPLGSHENYLEDAQYKHQDSRRNKLIGMGAVVCSGIFGAFAIEALIADQPLAGLTGIAVATGTSFLAKGQLGQARIQEEIAQHYDTLAFKTRED